MKIFCIGRNYPEHTTELGNAIPAEPVVFIKPETSLMRGSGIFYHPTFSVDLHHEIELVLRVSKQGRNLSVNEGGTSFDAIGVGIDFTARDLQNNLKSKGLPWEKSKAFDGSAPVSQKFIARQEFTSLQNINFHLEKNEQRVQSGNSGDMLFGFDELLAHISVFFTLEIGDLVFTGTPAGTGPVIVGDELCCFLEQQPILKVTIAG